MSDPKEVRLMPENAVCDRICMTVAEVVLLNKPELSLCSR